MIIPGWQKEILNKMYGGTKAGKLMAISAGRQTGKSYWMSAAFRRPYQVLGGAAQCDDGLWYQVYCRPDVAAWVRTQDPNSWMETGSHPNLGDFFDIKASVMIMLALKWS
jgi:hypothetical protein